MLLGQALGHVDALALPARELVQVPVRQVRHAHPLHRGGHGGAVRRAQAAEPAGGGVPAHRDDVAHRERHPLRELEGLHHERGEPPVPGRALPAHFEPARGRVQHAGEGLQEGGLAGPVGPDHGHHAAGRQREGGGLDGQVVPVAQLEVLGHGQRRGGGLGDDGGGSAHGDTLLRLGVSTTARRRSARTRRLRRARSPARPARTTKNIAIGTRAMVAEAAVPRW